MVLFWYSWFIKCQQGSYCSLLVLPVDMDGTALSNVAGYLLMGKGCGGITFSSALPPHFSCLFVSRETGSLRPSESKRISRTCSLLLLASSCWVCPNRAVPLDGGEVFYFLPLAVAGFLHWLCLAPLFLDGVEGLGWCKKRLSQDCVNKETPKWNCLLWLISFCRSHPSLSVFHGDKRDFQAQQSKIGSSLDTCSSKELPTDPPYCPCCCWAHLTFTGTPLDSGAEWAHLSQLQWLGCHQEMSGLRSLLLLGGSYI